VDHSPARKSFFSPVSEIGSAIFTNQMSFVDGMVRQTSARLPHLRSARIVRNTDC